MRISTKGRYALMVLIDLAEQGQDKPVSLRSVAERQGISEKYLEGIVARLGAAKLVDSIRGKYGGYLKVLKNIQLLKFCLLQRNLWLSSLPLMKG